MSFDNTMSSSVTVPEMSLSAISAKSLARVIYGVPIGVLSYLLWLMRLPTRLCRLILTWVRVPRDRYFYRRVLPFGYNDYYSHQKHKSLYT